MLEFCQEFEKRLKIMEKVHIKGESPIIVRKAKEEDLGMLSELLASEDLPVSDLGSHIHLYIWENSDKSVVAVGGWERYDQLGLLRSVLIPSRFRGTGVGRTWVHWLMEKAMQENLQQFYLLTTTAAPFFEKMGFQTVDRAEVPLSIQQTSEFSSLCPSTAVVMSKGLNA